jgi:hypothetical protein
MIGLLFLCDLPSGWALFYKLEAGALLILPDGVNGRFSDSNQALYSFPKYSLNGLLARHKVVEVGWSFREKSQPSHSSSYFTSILHISAHVRQQGLKYLVRYI